MLNKIFSLSTSAKPSCELSIIFSNGLVSAICGVISERMRRVIHANYVQEYARLAAYK